jgi:hypothetical protein
VEQVSKFNPLSILKVGSNDFIEQLAYLADALILTQSAKEPFWDDSARELVSGIMAYVVENPAFSAHASLMLVRKLLMRGNDEISRMIRTAVEEFPDSVAANKLGQFENKEHTASIPGVIQSARTQTAFLDSVELGNAMAGSDFSFEDLREGGRPTTVYLVLPPEKLRTYGRWLRLMVSIAIGTVQKGPLDAAERVDQGASGEAEGGDDFAEKVRAEFRNMDLINRMNSSLAGGIPVIDPGKPPAIGVLPGVAWPQGKEHRPEPLKKLPPELRGPTLFQRIKNYRKVKEKREDEKRAKRWAEFWKKMPPEDKEWFLRHLNSDEIARKYAEIDARKAAEGAEMKAFFDGSKPTVGAALPVLFLLDEFGTIGKLSEVSKAYGLMAGLGMVIWAFVQNLVQLKEHYPEEWETFIGNSNAIVCFGMMDKFTVDYVSNILGTTTVRYETTSVTDSISEKPGGDPVSGVIDKFFGDVPQNEVTGVNKSKATAEHVVAQPLCSPDEVRRLYSENCIVIGRGDPALCRRVAYFKDPTFAAWARPDPKYAKR